MKKFNVLYESKECISGYVHPTKEWIEYSGILTIKDGGKQPVTLEMTFIPPHPYYCNMPLQHSIKAKSVTDIYLKVMKYLKKYNAELK